MISLTGFGPFPGVPRNASADLVERLASRRERKVGVHTAVLPVAFEEVALALERHFEGLAPAPIALVATGVHRGDSLRIESRAGRVATSFKPDAEGRVGQGHDPNPAWEAELYSGLDLDEIARVLGDGPGPEVTRSDDAGGYLCERVYYLTLRKARALGVPALFVHIPGVEHGPVEDLLPAFDRLLDHLAER